MTICKSAFLAACLLATTACAPTPILTTTVFQSDQSSIRGIPYFLPLAQIPLSIAIDKDELTVTLEDKVLYADPTAALVANINIGSLSNDDVSIGTSDMGLLDFLTVSSEDVTDTIVTDTVTSVQSILRGEALAQRVGVVPASGAQKPGRHLLNPLEPLSNLSPTDLQRARSGKGIDLFSDLPPGFESATILYDDRGLADRIQNASDARVQTCPPEMSLCFPVLTLVKIRVAGDTFELEEPYAIPDPTRSFGITIDRRACVLSTYTLELNSGILTKFTTNSPSEVAGCLSIPIDVISSIIAAPINAIRGQTAELDAQAKLIEAQANLVNAQSNLQSAEE